MATTSVTFAEVGHQWNLLEQLKIWLVALVIIDGLFLLSLLEAKDSQSKTINAIGVMSEPSVKAAENLKIEIATMDAEAANELLATARKGGDASDGYTKHRNEAAKVLISAAENITYGEEERKPIRDLQSGLGEYEATVQRARDFHERGDDPEAVDAYRKASNLVAVLLKRADTLSDVNDAALTKAFREDQGKAGSARRSMLAVGLVLLGLLLLAQWRLAAQTRRLLNPGLVLASILTFTLFSYSSSRLSTAAHDLASAKVDAYESLRRLWQTRALAFEANADESKYLLRDDQAADEHAFFIKARAISQSSDNSAIPVVTGHLQDELKSLESNPTMPPAEKVRVDLAIQDWSEYMEIDSTIRQKERANKHSEAVRLCVGTAQGESDFAFEKFTKSLQDRIDFEEEAFQKLANDNGQGQSEIKNLNKVAVVGTILIAACCSFGLFVRIREFL